MESDGEQSLAAAKQLFSNLSEVSLRPGALLFYLPCIIALTFVQESPGGKQLKTERRSLICQSLMKAPTLTIKPSSTKILLKKLWTGQASATSSQKLEVCFGNLFPLHFLDLQPLCFLATNILYTM